MSRAEHNGKKCQKLWKGEVLPLDGSLLMGDFSVVLFRPNFMLAFEEHPVKMHKDQRLSTCYLPLLSLVEPRTRAHTMVSGRERPSQ